MKGPVAAANALMLGSTVLLACAGDGSQRGATIVAADAAVEPEALAGTARASGEEPPGLRGGEGAELVLHESVRVPCRLPEEESEGSRFDFDEVELRPHAERILAKLAACLRDGALANDTVVIVGYADPCGMELYGERLGLERAEAVRGYLLSQGVQASQLRLLSWTEAPAHWKSESWPLPSRVEVRAWRTKGSAAD